MPQAQEQVLEKEQSPVYVFGDMAWLRAARHEVLMFGQNAAHGLSCHIKCLNHVNCMPRDIVEVSVIGVWLSRRRSARFHLSDTVTYGPDGDILELSDLFH